MTGNAMAAIKTIEVAMVYTLEIEAAGKPVLADMTHVEAYLQALLGGKSVEELHVFYLDAKSRVIKTELATKGTVNSSALYPREIVKRALELGATGIMIAHNHPSGDTKPSAQDIDMTKKLAAGLKTMDIALIDHFIVGSGALYSFKAHGHDF
jgi:DNA repair protein RadC